MAWRKPAGQLANGFRRHPHLYAALRRIAITRETSEMNSEHLIEA
jgi:hypothetical protein